MENTNCEIPDEDCCIPESPCDLITDILPAVMPNKFCPVQVKDHEKEELKAEAHSRNHPLHLKKKLEYLQKGPRCPNSNTKDANVKIHVPQFMCLFDLLKKDIEKNFGSRLSSSPCVKEESDSVEKSNYKPINFCEEIYDEECGYESVKSKCGSDFCEPSNMIKTVISLNPSESLHNIVEKNEKAATKNWNGKKESTTGNVHTPIYKETIGEPGKYSKVLNKNNELSKESVVKNGNVRKASTKNDKKESTTGNVDTPVYEEAIGEPGKYSTVLNKNNELSKESVEKNGNVRKASTKNGKKESTTGNVDTPVYEETIGEPWEDSKDSSEDEESDPEKYKSKTPSSSKRKIRAVSANYESQVHSPKRNKIKFQLHEEDNVSLDIDSLLNRLLDDPTLDYAHYCDDPACKERYEIAQKLLARKKITPESIRNEEQKEAIRTLIESSQNNNVIDSFQNPVLEREIREHHDEKVSFNEESNVQHELMTSRTNLSHENRESYGGKILHEKPLRRWLVPTTSVHEMLVTREKQTVLDNAENKKNTNELTVPYPDEKPTLQQKETTKTVLDKPPHNEMLNASLKKSNIEIHESKKISFIKEPICETTVSYSQTAKREESLELKDITNIYMEPISNNLSRSSEIYNPKQLKIDFCDKPLGDEEILISSYSTASPELIEAKYKTFDMCEKPLYNHEMNVFYEGNDEKPFFLCQEPLSCTDLVISRTSDEVFKRLNDGKVCCDLITAQNIRDKTMDCADEIQNMKCPEKVVDTPEDKIIKSEIEDTSVKIDDIVNDKPPRPSVSKSIEVKPSVRKLPEVKPSSRKVRSRSKSPKSKPRKQKTQTKVKAPKVRPSRSQKLRKKSSKRKRSRSKSPRMKKILSGSSKVKLSRSKSPKVKKIRSKSPKVKKIRSKSSKEKLSKPKNKKSPKKIKPLKLKRSKSKSPKRKKIKSRKEKIPRRKYSEETESEDDEEDIEDDLEMLESTPNHLKEFFKKIISCGAASDDDEEEPPPPPQPPPPPPLPQVDPEVEKYKADKRKHYLEKFMIKIPQDEEADLDKEARAYKNYQIVFGSNKF